MIPFLPESWFPKKRNIDFHTPDRWWISPRIIQKSILNNQYLFILSHFWDNRSNNISKHEFVQFARFARFVFILSRRIISWMQNKNFTKSIFRNGPSDLQIRKPAVLLSGNDANRTIFLFTPITTGNIFSRKKLLTRPCQTSFHSHFLLFQTLILR